MKKLFVALLVAPLLVLAGIGLSNKLIGAQPAAAASGCDGYAIMTCGASSPSEFVKKAQADGHGDLQTVYANFGLVPTDYARFAREARMGTIQDNGNIVVDGRVVGKSTENYSRMQGSGFNHAVKIGNKTYYGGSFGSTYHANSASVMVLFNDKGVMQFAVINSCGNPQQITPVTPSYACNALQKTTVSGQPNAYSFTTKASAGNGATIIKAVYDFGDGQTQTVNNPATPVQHTFTKSSKVTVTLSVKLPGGQVVTTSGPNCATEVTITPPSPQAICSNLVQEQTNAGNRTYRFTAQTSVSNGAVLRGADFNFGDGVITKDVAPNGTQVTIEHSYGQAGNYTTVATVHFVNPDNSVKDVNCQASISPTECKPGVPTGSKECSECKPGIPVGSEDCNPKQLVNTGPGEVAAGLFAGVGTLAGVGHWFYRRRFGL